MMPSLDQILAPLQTLLTVCERIEHPACKEMVGELGLLIEELPQVKSPQRLVELSQRLEALAARAQAVLEEEKRVARQAMN